MQIIALDKPFIYNLLLWIQCFGRGDGRLFCRFKHSLPLLPFLFPFLGKWILLTAADDTTLANTFATHLAHSKSCVLAANFPKGPSKHRDGEEKQRLCICLPGPCPVLAFPAHISSESRRDSHQDACVSYDLKSHMHFIMLAHG